MGCNCGRRAVAPGDVTPASRSATSRRSAPAPAAVASAAASVASPDPLVWGPPLWRGLHIAAIFSDRMSVRDEWSTLVIVLRNSLPCPECTGHYRAWYISHPFIKGNNAPDVRKNAHEWFVALHNDVNVRTEKPTMTPDEAAALYEGDRLTRIAEAEAAVTSLQGVVGWSAVKQLLKILRLIKRI